MGRRRDSGLVDAELEGEAWRWLNSVGVHLHPATDDPGHTTFRQRMGVRRAIQDLRDEREAQGFTNVDIAPEVRALLAAEGLDRYAGLADRSKAFLKGEAV